MNGKEIDGKKLEITLSQNKLEKELSETQDTIQYNNSKK